MQKNKQQLKELGQNSTQKLIEIKCLGKMKLNYFFRDGIEKDKSIKKVNKKQQLK